MISWLSLGTTWPWGSVLKKQYDDLKLPASGGMSWYRLPFTLRDEHRVTLKKPASGSSTLGSGLRKMATAPAVATSMVE